MSYCSFVLSPVTSSGCDGSHCSGWLGGGAEVQQINAVQMTQNISFLTFNTHINTAMWGVLVVGQGVSYTAPHQISFFHILPCGVAIEGKCAYKTQLHTETNSKTFPVFTKNLLTHTSHIHLALPCKEGQGAQFYPSKQAHNIFFRAQIYLLSQKSQSWFFQGTLKPKAWRKQ